MSMASALASSKPGLRLRRLRSRTDAVLAAANKAASELSSHQRKVFRIADHAGVALAGLTADGRVLSRFLCSECINHAFVYDAPLPVSRLALRLANKPQVRPDAHLPPRDLRSTVVSAAAGLLDGFALRLFLLLLDFASPCAPTCFVIVFRGFFLLSFSSEVFPSSSFLLDSASHWVSFYGSARFWFCQGLCPRCRCFDLMSLIARWYELNSPPLLASGSCHRRHGDHRQTPDILGERQSGQDIRAQNVVACQAVANIVSSSLGLDKRKSSHKKTPKSQDNDNADNNGEALIEGDYPESGHAEDEEHIAAPRPKRSKKLMIYTHYTELRTSAAPRERITWHL